MKTFTTDFLVIGSGLAGLSFALKAAEKGSVIILAKSDFHSSSSTNSAMAQGGIAAVTSDQDSFESHINDTLVAGAGLCREDVVREFVTQAPDRIKDLVAWGVQFDGQMVGDEFQVNLTKEGGHSFRRILHHEDQTGFEIQSKLSRLVRNNPNIQILENYFAIDLIINKQLRPYDMSPIQCYGAYALNKNVQQQAQVEGIVAKNTILATGGAGKVYLYTSNWSGATGDGIAMAYRAGARVANMEFMQFHPTCLYHPQARNFLISEALRGEGGELINIKGEAFMKNHHPLGSLAPRDIVARSIDAEIKRTGADCVYLDMASKHSKDYLQSRFPVIYNQCLKYGIDMSVQPIPVVPAAHYLCGGVVTNSAGQTDIPGLFAVGETACTGLHGANRLASNSLLECLTTSHNAIEHIINNPISFDEQLIKDVPDWLEPKQLHHDELIVITHMWEEVRRLMWNYVGIVRSNKRLERAQHRLQNILNEVKEYYSQFKMNSDVIELRNIAIVADLSIRCAMKRKESRGIHFNIDYPSKSNDPNVKKDSFLIRGL